MSNDQTNYASETPVKPGQVWLRKNGSVAVVRRVTCVEDGKVHYEVLHGPSGLRKKPVGVCNLSSFLSNSRQVKEQADYSDLDGARRFDTFLVLTTKGEPLLRCSQKRAAFYLKKGYARQIEEGVLQFTDDRTEKTLEGLYLGEFSAFFLAVKNDRCVCCGREGRLSRHHVVPKRHKKKVPLPWRNCLSNVLFVCLDCHERYERTPEPDPDSADWKAYVFAWKDHFIRVMAPEHLPKGWDIVPVMHLEAVARKGETG